MLNMFLYIPVIVIGIWLHKNLPFYLWNEVSCIRFHFEVSISQLNCFLTVLLFCSELWNSLENDLFYWFFFYLGVRLSGKGQHFAFVTFFGGSYPRKKAHKTYRFPMNFIILNKKATPFLMAENCQYPIEPFQWYSAQKSKFPSRNRFRISPKW